MWCVTRVLSLSIYDGCSGGSRSLSENQDQKNQIYIYIYWEARLGCLKLIWVFVDGCGN